MIRHEIELFLNDDFNSLPEDIMNNIQKLQNLLNINKKRFEKKYNKKTVIKQNNNSIINDCLNKITNDTYEEHLENLTVLITKSENIDDTAEIIYNNCISNRFYSELYSELYHSLIYDKQFLIFKTLLDNKKDLIFDLYNNVEYISAEENYDKYCKNKKHNEDVVRSTTTFYSYLSQKKLLQIEFIYKIIFFLFEKIKEKQNHNIIFEFIENINIILNITKSNIKQDGNFQLIIDELNKIKSKNDVYSHINNKIQCKTMDILDFLDL